MKGPLVSLFATLPSRARLATLRTPAVGFALVCGFAVSVGCDNDDDTVFRQFNNLEDTVSVEIEPDGVGEARTFDIRSNTGAVTIGSATVDPGSGPVGTDHLLLVEVADTWEERIIQASISIESERGVEEYVMRQDAADPGIFDLTLTSLGLPDERRTDIWTLTLYEPVDAPAADFTVASDPNARMTESP